MLHAGAPRLRMVRIARTDDAVGASADRSLAATSAPPGETFGADITACRSSINGSGHAPSGLERTVLDVAKKYKTVRRALTDPGWSVARQHGSHELWAHPDHEDRIVVAGKDSYTVPVGTLGSIRRASGLENLR
jgi:predicted RNA binding protein YcfA (HicA-like mRNA interferase family)